MKKKILVVEDDFLDAGILIDELSALFPGIEFLGPAGSFHDAMQIMKEKTPHLVLLDIELGTDKFGGIKIAQHINDTHFIPFIYLTGLPDQECFELAKKTLPIHFLKKPYDKEGLVRAIELALEKLNQKPEQPQNITLFVKPHKEDKLWINTGRGNYYSIMVSDIAVVQANDHYVKIDSTGNEKIPLFKSTLREFYSSTLAHYKEFFWLSRSVIINLKQIEKIEDNHVHVGNDKFSIPKPSKERLLKELNIKVD